MWYSASLEGSWVELEQKPWVTTQEKERRGCYEEMLFLQCYSQPRVQWERHSDVQFWQLQTSGTDKLPLTPASSLTDSPWLAPSHPLIINQPPCWVQLEKKHMLNKEKGEVGIHLKIFSAKRLNILRMCGFCLVWSLKSLKTLQIQKRVHQLKILLCNMELRKRVILEMESELFWDFA